MVKVHKFPGGNSEDIQHHLIPIIKKKPSYLILHVGTNDATKSSSRDILNKLLNLKMQVTQELPDCKVFISTPTLRSDNGKAMLTLKQVTKHLLELNIDIVDNRNITEQGVGRKVLHLNTKGTSILTTNFILR